MRSILKDWGKKTSVLTSVQSARFRIIVHSCLIYSAIVSKAQTVII